MYNMSWLLSLLCIVWLSCWPLTSCNMQIRYFKFYKGCMTALSFVVMMNCDLIVLQGAPLPPPPRWVSSLAPLLPLRGPRCFGESRFGGEIRGWHVLRGRRWWQSSTPRGPLLLLRARLCSRAHHARRQQGRHDAIGPRLPLRPEWETYRNSGWWDGSGHRIPCHGR